MSNTKLLLIIFLAVLWSSNSLYAQKGFDKEKFKELTLQKTKDLGHYITTIGDKKFNRDYRDAAVQSALNLFISDKKIVHVSSLNHPGQLKEYSVRKYLNKLLILKYAKVEITWYDINVVSDFIPDPDGNLTAVVKIYQKFTGYDAEGNIVYEDITTKRINVKLTRIAIPTDRGVEHEMQVLLGDIEVEETKES